jgi:heme/copper-type cytochrome/quinol oxidase subunit 2
MPHLKVTLPAEQTVQEEALIRDGKYFRKLKELCGSFHDGSDSAVTLVPDDATRDWTLSINNKESYYAPTIEAVIDMALKEQQS